MPFTIILSELKQVCITFAATLVPQQVWILNLIQVLEIASMVCWDHMFELRGVSAAYMANNKWMSILVFPFAKCVFIKLAYGLHVLFDPRKVIHWLVRNSHVKYTGQENDSAYYGL